MSFQLRIKIFYDGRQRLQYLAARCGEKEVWKSVPIVFEDIDQDSEEHIKKLFLIEYPDFEYDVKNPEFVEWSIYKEFKEKYLLGKL